MSCPHKSRNYSDQKIKEFEQKVDQLKKEHQKFVAKVQRLDPSYKDIIPWQPRGYNRKRSHDSHVTSVDHSTISTSGSASKKLCSPLLEKEQKEKSHDSHVTGNPHTTYSRNPLGLEYSSSEDES